MSGRTLTESSKCVKLFVVTSPPVDATAVETAADDARADGDKRSLILDAAIEEFSARGFSSTSMANIADAAGMSRPALYQHFKNKSDIFVSGFTALLDNAVDRSLAALDADAPTSKRLDDLLQRFDGDLWERMAASPHSEELFATAGELSPALYGTTGERLWQGLDAHLIAVGAGDAADEPAAQRAEWIELLRLAPKGFKTDRPSIETYRRRLRSLAVSVAADIDATTPH